MEQLLSLPVPSLVSAGALVAVWVTNKRGVAWFVEHRLFPAWGVEMVGEWTWVKVRGGVVDVGEGEGWGGGRG